MILFAILGLTIILIILWDAFETIFLPRRVTRKIRLARIFYKTIWQLWKKQVPHIFLPKDRETYLGYFGPLSFLLLLLLWAIGLVFGFALINFGLTVPLSNSGGKLEFLRYLLASSARIIPIEFQELSPENTLGRITFIAEAAVGYSFFAATITYLPILYQSFSRREVNINLLDSRAGSPPHAIHLLKQYSGENIEAALTPLFESWEIWCAELLESHLSYPVLAYYRSQHDNESWVSAILMILDISALTLVGIDGVAPEKAKYTFAIGNHAVIDLTQNFNLTPQNPPQDRLPHKDFQKMIEMLRQHGIRINGEKMAEEKLKQLRVSYEPFIQALSNYFLMPIAPFLPTTELRRTD